MSRCTVTDLLIDSCAHCRFPSAPTPPDPFSGPSAKLGRWFTSAYSGSCSGCGEQFEEFDQIRSDGEGGYLAECCGGTG
jgi:hypothetical protein